MKIDNKGMTIVEIIVSICIISIVIILLFTMLIQVQQEDSENSIQSTFLINQSLFIKTIQEDILDYGVTAVESCELSDVNIGNDVVNVNLDDSFKCVKIKYGNDFLKDNIGYILIYNYYTKTDASGNKRDPKWVIQYLKGHYENTLPNGDVDITSWKSKAQYMKEFIEYGDKVEPSYVLYTAGFDIDAASIVIPIIAKNGFHYDVNLGFTIKNDEEAPFKCHTTLPNLNCICKGDSTLCNKTKN